MVGGDDVHQVLCYLLLTGAKFGGLVFPPIDTNCEDKDSITASENGGEGQESILAAENRGKNKQTHKAGWSIQRNIYSPYPSEESSICWSCFSWESWEVWKRERNSGNDWDSFEKYMEEQERALVCGVRGAPALPNLRAN